MNEMKKAVVTVLGIDSKGIIARVTNILDISQTVLADYFNMVLVADVSSPACSFEKLSNELTALGEKMGLQIRIQRSEIFEAMHQV